MIRHDTERDGQCNRNDNAKKKGSTGIGDESISVVLFVDGGLEKSQQKFADLNRFGVRPNGSLSLLYDQRDEFATLAKAVVHEVPLFAKLTDGEKTSIAGGSSKLFALSAVHEATRALLRGSSYNREESKKLAVSFWSEVARVMPDWQAAADGKIRAAELREKYVHAHALALEAIGRAGNALLRERPETWKKDLAVLAALDWCFEPKHRGPMTADLDGFNVQAAVHIEPTMMKAASPFCATVPDPASRSSGSACFRTASWRIESNTPGEAALTVS